MPEIYVSKERITARVSEGISNLIINSAFERSIVLCVLTSQHSASSINNLSRTRERGNLYYKNKLKQVNGMDWRVSKNKKSDFSSPRSAFIECEMRLENALLDYF